MDSLPTLLLIAWLLPLASFAVIVLGYSAPQMVGLRVSYARQKLAAYIAIGAIGTGCLLSFVALGKWLSHHPLGYRAGAGAEAAEGGHAEGGEHGLTEGHNNPPPPYLSNDWYNLAVFGKLRLAIGYYIDTLTVVMFCVVTLIATCVHIYSLGYMHDELHDVTDHEVTLSSGQHLHRRGRFHRFFQYLSLFSFSMLGICVAGNLAMTFVFWELVGICSYFLIGFYIERHSASTAANKAFIVNRIGDFGMLIGLMALWSSLGTLHFGDTKDADGSVVALGIFSQLHTEANHYMLAPAAGMDQWLLFVAGVGIFCGCMGKSAQFPLHTWLPDAMEGPTPVSALVHSATMVAAGVFLVGRCYPIFSPEALLIIALIGCVTLFLAATIAITQVDIKRVLAYSTVSQLGFMMLALGLGGWVAGLFHLITHAFFKGLLFLGSGSVIHAVHTNDMRLMGGLRKKMPITAYTMLIGCLAIAGVGIPFVIGFSGFHSKDLIVEQALSFAKANGQSWAWLLFFVPVVGAAITAFYMFRLWYMTFAGEPRDHHRFDHAHESPPSMSRVLVFLAVFAVGIGWSLPKFLPGAISDLGVQNLLEQARPVGTQADKHGAMVAGLTMPDEHLPHQEGMWRPIVFPAGLAAITAAALGILFATMVYVWKTVSADRLKQGLRPLYELSWHKWWFDELYDWLFVRPALAISAFIARALDRGLIDSFLHACAWSYRNVSRVVAYVGDRLIIDNGVDTFAAKTWDLGLSLRAVQTGRLRQYVMFIVVGTIVLFAVASLWRFALAR
jgi:NADH-quinone oxidoreductase subunit L